MTDDDTPECEQCGEPASPGGDPDLCPACEDAPDHDLHSRPNRVMAPTPPHGNTTR